MDQMDQARRLSFGRIAELYDRRRPTYPAELIDDVIALAGGVPLRALEVGAGTGKATALFAARGVAIDAVEPSVEMAALARANVGDEANIAIVEAEFESLPAPAEPYDLLFSGQAWHWIDPDTRYVHARAALRPGGVLAPFWNRDVWDGNPLYDVLDRAYRTFAPELSDPGRPRTGGRRNSADPAVWTAEITAAAGLTDPEVRSYEWQAVYSAREYTELLATHSDHALLPEHRRLRLLGAVATAIDDAGGELRLDYLAHCCLARAV
jgi:SAM-dependent methyltransferase